MTSDESKSGLAPWLKTTLTIASVLAVTIVVLFAAGFAFFQSAIKSDAQGVKNTVDSLISMKRPLPADYKYHMAMDLSFVGTKLGVIIHSPENMTLMISEINGSNQNLTPERLIASIPKRTHGGKLVVDKSGNSTVGGKALKFVSGRTKSGGTEVPVYVGTMLLTEPTAHMFVVVATLEEPGILNQNALDEFLENIETVK